ncbi:MAG TPA: phosphoglycerate kinase [Abditibacteriaceae bacterium]|jgi:phosphoglycerate kinase
MNKKTISDVDLLGKTVLMRVDYNVPMDEHGHITDDSRIRETLPTLNYLMSQGAKIILMAHFGRPKGQVVENLRLKPIAAYLGNLLGDRGSRPVKTAASSVGAEVSQAVAGLQETEILLLENIRFHAEEEKNDAAFARQLADLADVYVNDAFGAAHRAHASTEGVARAMREAGKPAVAGLLMARELEHLSPLLQNPQRPFVAILGGVKVSDKIGVIRNLLDKVDTLLVGGAMSYAFEKAQNREVGTSYFKSEDAPIAAELLQLARDKGKDFRLPLDFLVADRDAEDAQTKIVPAGGIPADMMGMDIGPETIANYSKIIEGAKTVLWNGPMGRFEVTPFANGTRAVAQAVGRATQNGATTIIGGGDSAAAVKQMDLDDQMTHVSTGGGASLEFLEGIELPGVAALDDK